ncbi:hypothetical protein [Bradyrhizobium sp. dw_78]|uniref:hypothetical protein n=1 Tax=Bradyrhizobium sp. dw_78 TaxID=2719793 RepID=UPI001BD31F00|nr:hypothetical protein [Bradyrhizobium sp. dw_78]
MADAVTTQIIENSSRNLVMTFTNISDGTGEAAVIKVDATALNLTPHLKVRKIEYNVTQGAVQLQWCADVNVTFAYLTGFGCMDLRDTQGIWNNAGSGVNSSICLTTSAFHAPGTSPETSPPPASGYTITLYMIKGS